MKRQGEYLFLKILDIEFMFIFIFVSALDTASEYQVKEALERVMKGRSVITIAHRISTIQNAGTVKISHCF